VFSFSPRPLYPRGEIRRYSMNRWLDWHQNLPGYGRYATDFSLKAIDDCYMFHCRTHSIELIHLSVPGKLLLGESNCYQWRAFGIASIIDSLIQVFAWGKFRFCSIQKWVFLLLTCRRPLLIYVGSVTPDKLSRS